jgi:hypothetical protein
VKETGRFLGLGRLAAPLADGEVRRAGGLARAAVVHRGAALGARCPRVFPGALGNRNGDEDSQAHDRSRPGIVVSGAEVPEAPPIAPELPPEEEPEPEMPEPPVREPEEEPVPA